MLLVCPYCGNQTLKEPVRCDECEHQQANQGFEGMFWCMAPANERPKYAGGEGHYHPRCEIANLDGNCPHFRKKADG